MFFSPPSILFIVTYHTCFFNRKLRYAVHSTPCKRVSLHSIHSNKNLLTEGSIWKKLMGFAFPLFLGNLFQQLYNTADSLIVGNFLGSDALAAVSSSGSLTFLLVGFFQGLAMGAGVIIARYFGARQKKELHRAIHTTVAFGILCGILLTAGGVVLAPKILILMKTPADILPKSAYKNHIQSYIHK